MSRTTIEVLDYVAHGVLIVTSVALVTWALLGGGL